jgi:hypothetical protein
MALGRIISRFSNSDLLIRSGHAALLGCDIGTAFQQLGRHRTGNIRNLRRNRRRR